MKIVPKTTSIYERVMAENKLANEEKLEAEKDFNEMMGTWIDPSVQEEEEPDGQ
jgi:hypothetical protein